MSARRLRVLAWVGMLLIGCEAPRQTGADETSTAVETSTATADGTETEAATALSTSTSTDTDVGSETSTAVTLEVGRPRPDRGPVSGGTLVLLQGSGLAREFAPRGGAEARDQTQVLFGGNPALDINVVDDDTVEVRSPPGLAGSVDVQLTNPNGTVLCSGCFRYFVPVEATSIAPAHGSTRGDTELLLQGAGLVPGVQLLLGGDAATVVSVAADGRSLVARTPPRRGDAAGVVDVTLVGDDGVSVLPGGFAYVAPLRVTAVEPPAAGLASGAVVSVLGEGFVPESVALIDGVAAATRYVSAGRLDVTLPAAAVAQKVDVAVRHPRAQASLSGALWRYGAGLAPSLQVVAPAAGPTTGGGCAPDGAGCLRVAGDGFDEPLELRVGGRVASARRIDSHLLEVALPPGTAGPALLQLRTASGTAEASGLFRYDAPIQLTAISPATIDAGAQPATTAVLSGAGLSADCEVRVGAAAATVQSAAPDGSSLQLLLPPGSPGVRDVRVRCAGTTGAPEREAALVDGFVYTAALQLRRLVPDTGSQAGGASVVLYGSGLDAGLQAQLGGRPVSDWELLGPHVARLRVPPGAVGAAELTASDGATRQASLLQAFQYVDPTNGFGGASGGPLRGTLNITILGEGFGFVGAVPGATVRVQKATPGGVMQSWVGLTDARGQVTLSAPSLLGPVSITATRPRLSTAQLIKVDARDVTLYLRPNDAGDISDALSSMEGDDAPVPEPGRVTGRVCGFKLPPGVTLREGQSLEARVYPTATSVYGADPFGTLARPSVVASDCGGFSIASSRFGKLTLFAVFGVLDGAIAPPVFRPVLMGVRRAVRLLPAEETSGQEIVLDMHLDQSVPVTIDGPQPEPGRRMLHDIYAYLDLGGDGVVPLGQRRVVAAPADDGDAAVVLDGLPRVAGEGLVLLDVAAQAAVVTGAPEPPFSYFYRRRMGDPSDGVPLGPMLPLTRWTQPAGEGVPFDGRLGWRRVGEGPAPDLSWLSMSQATPLFSLPVLQTILPGDEAGTVLPPEALERLTPGGLLSWQLWTARVPRFDYDRFGFRQLSVNAWTAFTRDYGSFRVP